MSSPGTPVNTSPSSSLKVVEWAETDDWSRPIVRMLDQRALPGTVGYLDLKDIYEVAHSIRDMAVRGAPAIGIAAGYGMALAARHNQATSLASWLTQWDADRETLRCTRPTAVNLAWALDRVDRVLREVLAPGCDLASTVRDACRRVLDEALLIDAEDVWMCRTMGDFGAELVPSGATILTHCNAGGLATGGYGTAVGVIRSAWARHGNLHVFVDETRPLLQGARLTAFELDTSSIPFTLITDNMAGYFMKAGRINLAVVGADRICSNGDVANKIGTYSVAVLCKHHGIPFYVAAPFSTVDMALSHGDQIEIEQRSPLEVTHHGGKLLAPLKAQAANPAFDVTPNELITAIITERGVLRPPFTESLARAAATPVSAPARA